MVSRDPGRRRVPRQERSRATVAAILEAAAAIIAEDDARNLSTRDIAARAGVGVGSLYEYFGGKRAVVEGLVERFAAQIASAADGVFDARTGEDIDTMVVRLLRCTIGVYERNTRLHAHLLRDQPHLSGATPLDAIEGPIRRRFADLLRDCADELDIADVERAALVCVHTARRMIDAACADPALTIDLSEAEAEIAVLLQRYLHGRAPGEGPKLPRA